jgi:bifunctional ADP-heptose synthase (sugar kinase/adenylyltransferase)
MKILIIGESCKDIFHYGEAKRLCPEAPVPVFNSKFISENGGMAMNVYNNIISLGFVPKIITNPNWQSITKTRFVDETTNHMFMRLDESDDKFPVCDVEDIDYSAFDAIIVSDYDKGYLTEAAMQHISKKHPLTFLDTKKKFGKWCENFTFIKVNHSEFLRNQGRIGPEISEKLIVTRGPLGCTYGGKFYKVPLVEVKDTSGAGDTFVSALCVKYCQTNDIEEAIDYANRCATVVVQKKGVATA